MKRGYTEEDFRNMGRIAASEVIHTSTMVVKDLTDGDFVAKFSGGEGKGDPDFQARMAELILNLKFLLHMIEQPSKS